MHILLALGFSLIDPIALMVGMPCADAKRLRELPIAGYEIWLFGSRANGSARTESDWDLLVVGSPQLLEQLANQRPFERCDLMVVVDGDNFVSPWLRHASADVKHGSLSEWRWKGLPDGEASYESSSWDSERRRPVTKPATAIRLIAGDVLRPSIGQAE